MTNTSCTLVVLTQDKIHFPIKTAYVVIKQLFQYGVRDISIKGDDKLFISLSYSPMERTLKKKFGNLPLRYMRTKLDNDEEFDILERVVKRYKFNLVDDENVEDFESLPPPPKRRYLEPPQWNDDEGAVEDDTPGTPSPPHKN